MAKICSVCLSSDILCSGCARKMEQGHMSKDDVEVSRALFKLGIDTDFMKSFDFENSLFLLATKKQTGLLIGRAGRTVKRLGIMLGRDIRVIEHSDDEKKLIERIVGTQVIGINKVYGDNESYKVRVERRFRSKANAASPIVSRIINKPVHFVFE